MKTTITLLFALNLFVVFTKTVKVKDDLEDVWIWNGTTVTSASKPINPLATSNTKKDFYDKLTCTVALQKANKALDEFTSTIKGASDDWIGYTASEKLNRFIYYLDKGCEGVDLKIINKGTIGLNKTENDACKNLTKLIEALVRDDSENDDDEDDLRILSSEFLGNLATCKKALKLKNKLGAECKLAAIEDIKGEESKIEELNLPPLTFLNAKKKGHGSSYSSKRKEDLKKEEKSENKKEEEKDEDEETEEQDDEKDLETEKEKEKENKNKVEEKNKEQAKNKNKEPIEEESNLDGFVIRVSDIEDDHVDSYTISYHQEPNGGESVVIAYVLITESIHENEDIYMVSL